MINIVVPMGGKSVFYDDKRFVFPKPLVEISGKPMIQHVVDSLSAIKGDLRFIYVINQQDADRYHLGNILKLLTGENSIVITQQGDTKGAVCSILLAIEHIDNSDELIVANSDQVIIGGLDKALEYFRSEKADAGTLCFDSVHPQWSYVQTDKDGLVIETAEKRPISRNAIAGVYYFSRGELFVDAATRCIEKDASVNDKYFTSLTFNELVLDGKKILTHRISHDNYHSFYAPEKIELFEKYLAAHPVANAA